VAEVMPTAVRAHALGLMQALAAIGTILAAWMLGAVVPHWGWEGLYYLGALPALVAVLVFGSLREPAKWVTAKAAAQAAGNGAGRHFGALNELFTDARWRRRTLVGAALGLSGIIGLWGAVYWSPELIDTAIPTLEIATRPKVVAWLQQATPDRRAAATTALQPAEAEQVARLLEKTFWPGQKLTTEAALTRALTPAQTATMTTLVQHTVTNSEKTQLKSKALMLQQVGSFFGVLAFTIFAARFGRRRAFLIALLMAWASVVSTFYWFREPGQIWFFYPWLGFGALAVFGGYAIYFPELFPTRLRSTGTGFCYNVSRFAAIVGPLTMGALAQSLEGVSSIPAFRLAAIIMASAYFIGIVALIWAPETRGQRLPEEDLDVVT
jgi:MFS family permease